MPGRHRSLLLLGLLLLAVVTASCAQVRPHLVLPQVAVGDPAFIPTVQAHAATPVVGGNRVEFETLMETAQRGVRVVLLLPGPIDASLLREASRLEFGRLLRAGVEIHEYQPALLHAKTMVIDGAWATIGSANLDNRSLALNDELNLVLYDREVASRLEQIFHEDLAYSRRVERSPAWRRSMDWLLKLLAFPARDQF